MKRPPSRSPSPRADVSPPQAAEIDALYGLEPVFEPAGESDPARTTAPAFHTIQCPYCGERFETLVDPANGGATYIEDCQVCCQPIEFELEIDAHGAFTALSVRRS